MCAVFPTLAVEPVLRVGPPEPTCTLCGFVSGSGGGWNRGFSRPDLLLCCDARPRSSVDSAAATPPASDGANGLGLRPDGGAAVGLDARPATRICPQQRSAVSTVPLTVSGHQLSLEPDQLTQPGTPNHTKRNPQVTLHAAVLSSKEMCGVRTRERSACETAPSSPQLTAAIAHFFASGTNMTTPHR
jgi:hypothetical protein